MKFFSFLTLPLFGRNHFDSMDENREAGLSKNYLKHYKSFDEFNYHNASSNEFLEEIDLYLKTYSHEERMKGVLNDRNNLDTERDNNVIASLSSGIYRLLTV